MERLSLCVFCASSDHLPDAFIKAARGLGEAMLRRGCDLVYGGGNNGLMGVLAEVIHDGGGHVTGVITGKLKGMGYAYSGADEMVVTIGMRERKAIMEARADGFIGLPGGYGTLEELLEIITLRQLGHHDKPIAFLNVDGFFEGLLDQFNAAKQARLIDASAPELFIVTDDIERALDHVTV